MSEVISGDASSHKTAAGGFRWRGDVPKRRLKTGGDDIELLEPEREGGRGFLQPEVAVRRILETADVGLPGTDVEMYIPRIGNTKLFGRLSVVVP